MQAPRGYVAVAGSERTLPDEARRVGPVPEDERVEATIVLRPNPRRAARVGARGRGAQPEVERAHLSLRRQSLGA